MCFKCNFYLTRQASKNKLLFTITAKPGRRSGHLCSALWDSQSRPDVTQSTTLHPSLLKFVNMSGYKLFGQRNALNYTGRFFLQLHHSQTCKQTCLLLEMCLNMNAIGVAAACADVLTNGASCLRGRYVKHLWHALCDMLWLICYTTSTLTNDTPGHTHRSGEIRSSKGLTCNIATFTEQDCTTANVLVMVDLG